MCLLGQPLKKSGVLDRADNSLYAEGLELFGLLFRTDKGSYLKGVLLGVCEQLTENSTAKVT